jgi:hypothetical protein
MYKQWRKILQNKEGNPSDKFRCPYFMKLISHLSCYISNKLTLCYEFGHYLDTAFNIDGIIQNSDFKNGEGANGKNCRKSPLQIQFIKRLGLQWKHLTVLNVRILEPPFYLKSLRLQIAINLMDEQYNLMCTIAHLFMSFLITFELLSHKFEESIRKHAAQFIKDFKFEY